MEMFCSNCHSCFWLHIGLCKCKAWIESMMFMFGARWSQLILRIILGLALGKFIVWVTYDVCMTNVRTLCTLAFVVKSSGVVNAHIFHSWVRWYYLHSFFPLHANFVILLPCVWRIILEKIIMLCINYHKSLEWLFISRSTSIMWWMASARSLWMRLKGWSQRRLTAHLMQRYLWFQ